MRNRELDELIKDYLKNYNADIPSDWNRMQDMIINQENLDFDNQIKNDINNYNSPLQADWSKMESMIQESEIMDFDQFIKESVTSNPSLEPQWDEMEEILEEEDTINRQVFYIKILEAVVILLVVLSLFTMQNASKYHVNSQSIALQYMLNDATNISENPLDVFGRNESLIDNKSLINKKTEQKEEKENILEDDESTDNIENTIAYFNYKKKLNSIPHVVAKVSTTNAQGNAIVTIPTKLPTNYLNDIDHAIADVSEEDKEGKSKYLSPYFKKPKMRMSLSTGIDFVSIQSGYVKNAEQVNGNSSYNIIGHQAVLNISFIKKRWEIETGIIYKKKKYQTTPVIHRSREFVNEKYTATLTDHYLSAPIHLRYYITPHNKFKFYVLGGGSAHLLAFNDTNIDIQNLDNGLPLGMINTKKGFFREGNLINNLYLTSDIGLGVESQITKNLSVFAQPKFSYHIYPFAVEQSTLGKNEGSNTQEKYRFNDTSIQIGLRWNL